MKQITGTVIHGKKLGRTIGYPTANIHLEKWTVDDGVYNCNIVYNDIIYRWAWVYRETLELFEVYIFWFNAQIYWENIDVYILEKIRENKKVNSLEEVKNLIDKDVKQITESAHYILSFWSFDLIHKWHRYYLHEAKKYWNKLVTIVATDKNIEKFKKKAPLYEQTKRIQDVKNMDIADIVILWWESSHLDWIDLYQPKTVCLWYDQKGFADQLDQYIVSHNLSIEIIRVPSLQPEHFKSSIIKKSLL